MKPIRIAWFACILTLTGFCLLAEPLLSKPYTFIAIRNALVTYTGIVTVGVMSMALMLAMRPSAPEPALGGLDKMYRLHKWLGITALVMAVMHWASTQAPRWLAGLGWLQRTQRPHAVQSENTFVRFMQSQRGLAETAGEWAFYAALVLIVLA